MKLFIWNNLHPIRYGGRFIYAIAPDLKMAEQLARHAPISYYGSEPRERDTLALGPLGEPDRILDLPCAECFQWEV